MEIACLRLNSCIENLHNVPGGNNKYYQNNQNIFGFKSQFFSYWIHKLFTTLQPETKLSATGSNKLKLMIFLFRNYYE